MGEMRKQRCVITPIATKPTPAAMATTSSPPPHLKSRVGVSLEAQVRRSQRRDAKPPPLCQTFVF